MIVNNGHLFELIAAKWLQELSGVFAFSPGWVDLRHMPGLVRWVTYLVHRYELNKDFEQKPYSTTGSYIH